MLPVIALVGRPNVGKSTVFNRFTRSRDALVADYSGLTRDRQYGKGQLDEREFMVIDTGGVTGEEQGLDAEMAKQSYMAIEEADAVLFLVDGRSGIVEGDRHLAEMLRRIDNKPIWLVVNKTDGIDADVACSEFWELGLAIQPFPIAASQNRGMRSLLETVLDKVAEGFVDPEEHLPTDWRGRRIAVIGRPNVGKSTLVNRILGEERVVVYDHPGTTMDSIYIPFERHGEEYTLIDTAGVRRRKNIKEAVEKFSIVKTLKAIDDANVIIAVFDAREGIVEQDLTMLRFALEAGRALVIAINKWDGMTGEEKEKVRTDISRRLEFVDYADLHFISAKHGTNVGHLFESADVAYECAFAKWSTNFLSEILQGVVENHQPPLVNGRRIKLRYAHQGGSNPPRIVVHGNQVDKLPGSYKRYMENTFRKVLEVSGTPIKFEFKSGHNPYADKSEGRRKTRR
ncbi:ribosome biogenesis GTPase Der [Salinibius halmophilus]|uniref:ribosome biogenesis GTPase Der n=1 Tax=Salinibius halmophilus TaxID=1853216 RepID=UPI000E65FA6F|nr:ribosome biogenesis GTPase Der [Salinibius halmophilus]